MENRTRNNPLSISQSGFSIIEIGVTLAITVIGLLGLLSIQLETIRSVQDSSSRAQAIWVVDDLINRVRANETANYNTHGMVSCESLIGQSSKPCSSYHNGTDVVPAGDCTAEEMMHFDLKETVCGSMVEINGKAAITTSSSKLSDPLLSITNSGPGSTHSLTLSWVSRVAADGKETNSVYRVSAENLDEQLNDSGELRSEYTVDFRP